MSATWDDLPWRWTRPESLSEQFVMKMVGGGGRTFHCPSWKKQAQSFPLYYAYGWATVEKRIVGKHQKADALVRISLPPCLWKKHSGTGSVAFWCGWRALLEFRIWLKRGKDMVKIIDSFRESAMQISAVCEKQAVLFRLSCSLLLAVRKAVSPTAKARFNSGRECHPAAMFCLLPWKGGKLHQEKQATGELWWKHAFNDFPRPFR